jgi:8-oxo-dGTP diphosphatase
MSGEEGQTLSVGPFLILSAGRRTSILAEKMERAMPSTTRVTRKVFAYVTHTDRLLVFSQPGAPEAGIQVPAGTVEAGEDPDAAVMREAFEETGLTGVRLVRFLGEQVRDMSTEGLSAVHHRRFYHLQCEHQPPERWEHAELYPSDGSPGPIIFSFSWVRMPDEIPNLIADHGALLPRLCEALAIRPETIPPH